MGAIQNTLPESIFRDSKIFLKDHVKNKIKKISISDLTENQKTIFLCLIDLWNFKENFGHFSIVELQVKQTALYSAASINKVIHELAKKDFIDILSYSKPYFDFKLTRKIGGIND